MCFGGGPSEADKAAALSAREQAEADKREAVLAKASAKKDAISAAVTGSDAAGVGGGKGRRSLFLGGGGGRGYASRFG